MRPAEINRKNREVHQRSTTQLNANKTSSEVFCYTSTMKRNLLLLSLQILVGLALFLINLEVFHFVRVTSNLSSGWASFIPAIGIGYFALLVLVLLADFLWALVFITWMLKRIFHITNEDHTITLP